LRLHVKGPRDLIAGLLFIVVGAAAALTAWSYPMGTALRMGPGYFPFLAGCGLTIVGLIVAVRGLAARDQAVEALHLKPLFLVLLAVALFAVLIDRLGLVITVPLVVLVCYLANPRPRVIELSVLAALLTLGAVVVFQRFLELPFRLWPE
jgi:putative tricarboxylic transport membrane protein